MRFALPWPRSRPRPLPHRPSRRRRHRRRCRQRPRRPRKSPWRSRRCGRRQRVTAGDDGDIWWFWWEMGGFFWFLGVSKMVRRCKKSEIEVLYTYTKAQDVFFGSEKRWVVSPSGTVFLRGRSGDATNITFNMGSNVRKRLVFWHGARFGAVCRNFLQ